MTAYKLTKKCVVLWQIRILLLALFLCGIAVWFFHISYAFIFTAVSVISLAFVFGFWYFPQYAQNFSLEITDTAVTVKSGVIIKTVKIMPLLRTIYVTRYSTLLSSAFKLNSLCLRAARGILITPEIDIDACLKVERAVKGED